MPQPNYWGGAFWGAVPLGVAIGAYVAVIADSPGYTLLTNYSLVQAPCDPSQPQVEIYGPDGSVICALPNSLVAAGRYEIDVSTLTLQVTTDE